MRHASVALWLPLVLLTACVGRGEVTTLNVHAVRPPVGTGITEQDVAVAVLLFDDSRPERCRLGIRTHFAGGQSYFKMEGAKPGEVVPKALTDYLRAQGWRAEIVRAEPQPARQTHAPAKDVVISGRVLDFSVEVDGKWLGTDITARTRIAVQAANASDGSQTRLTLRGSGTHRVLWFDPDDAERLMNDVLTETIRKFLLETSLEDKALRLK